MSAGDAKGHLQVWIRGDEYMTKMLICDQLR